MHTFEKYGPSQRIKSKISTKLVQYFFIDRLGSPTTEFLVLARLKFSFVCTWLSEEYELRDARFSTHEIWLML